MHISEGGSRGTGGSMLRCLILMTGRSVQAVGWDLSCSLHSEVLASFHVGHSTGLPGLLQSMVAWFQEKAFPEA